MDKKELFQIFLFFEKYTIDSITIVEFIMYNKNRN